MCLGNLIVSVDCGGRSRSRQRLDIEAAYPLFNFLLDPSSKHGRVNIFIPVSPQLFLYRRFLLDRKGQSLESNKIKRPLPRFR